MQVLSNLYLTRLTTVLIFIVVMMEKKMWKVELSQKMKEIDSLQASAKRSNSCRSDITQKAEQYLADRCELESEVAALGTQVRHSTFIRIADRCAITLALITCTNMRGSFRSAL